MGILTRLLEPKAATFGPLEDFWYRNIAGATASGERINPKTAMAISTVFACVRIISSTIAMLPLIVFERNDDGGKKRAMNHPLFPILHRQPNMSQTSFQYREMLMVHALLRGNGYAQIVPGPRGFADQLIPLNPDRMKVSRADTGELVYEYRRPDGRTDVFLQDEIFHLMNTSDDGITGMSTVALAKDSFGLAKSTENHGNRFFSEGQVPPGALQMPGKLSKEGHERLRDDWQKKHSGLQNSQNIAILEEGLEFKAMALTNEDSQFLETRLFQVEEIASWFGVPLSLLQHTEKSTSWGEGIALLIHGFVTFTIQPWLARWEQEIDKDLILDPERFFAEFVIEGLLKGDPATRSEFYNIMVRIGVMTRNEVRKIENLNPIPGLDEPLDPATTNERGGVAPAGSLALELATDTAARMVRKESGQIEKAAKKFADDPAGWAAWVGEFYEGYRVDLMEVCKLSDIEAFAYADDSRTHLLTSGVGAYFERPARAEDLVSLMMGNE